MTGIPRVDPTAFGAYYAGPADAPAARRPGRRGREPLPHTPYPELSTGMLLRPVKPPPSEGWRRLLYGLSGQLINLGESPRAIRYNNLVAQVNRPLRGCYRIAMLSLKGGVGKTTITATLGATFASIRGDRVVAVDANPDRGTLSQKVPLETAATVRQLLRDAGSIERYSDVRRYTSQGPSGLEVLASESDPAMSEAFSADDYARDPGHPGAVLRPGAHRLRHRAAAFGDVVGAGEGRRADRGQLRIHRRRAQRVGDAGLAGRARPRGAGPQFDRGHQRRCGRGRARSTCNKVVDHFSRRCRAVRLVPFDPHLEEGAEISLDRLKRETREALTELAAVVADGFPGDQRNPGVCIERALTGVVVAVA